MGRQGVQGVRKTPGCLGDLQRDMTCPSEYRLSSLSHTHLVVVPYCLPTRPPFHLWVCRLSPSRLQPPSPPSLFPTTTLPRPNTGDETSLRKISCRTTLASCKEPEPNNAGPLLQPGTLVRHGALGAGLEVSTVVGGVVGGGALSAPGPRGVIVWPATGP